MMQNVLKSWVKVFYPGAMSRLEDDLDNQDGK